MKPNQTRQPNEPDDGWWPLTAAGSGESGKGLPTGRGATASFSPPQRLLGLLLAGMTFLAYLPAFHAGFIWDDDLYVTNNPLLTAPDGWWRIWFSLDSPSQYFPLTYSVFRLQHSLWGFLPAGYHWCNIVLHASNALLLWQLLQRLRVPGAWLAAAIFALHPVQVESVAWITELKNVLSLCFMLLALLAWLEFVAGAAKPAWRWYLLALLGQALALTAKSTACTLPAALLLVLWLQHQPIRWFRLAQIAPFLAMGAVMGLLAMWWERYHQGTQGKWFALNFSERLLVASHAIWFYLGKLVWPVNLMFSYPHWTLNPADATAYGWLAAEVGLGAAIYCARSKTGRGLEVAMLFFVLTLSPLLGFIMLFTFLYTFVADHYQYVACIGPIALAAAGISKAFGAGGKAGIMLKPGFCGALLLTLGILTSRQCGMYADPEILWQTTITRNPASWMAHVNLGEFLAQQGRVDEAMSQWRQALQIKPDDALAYYDLGVAGGRMGKVEESVANYRQALEIQPDLVQAGTHLAWVLATCPKASLRNGPQAVELAQRADQLTRGTDVEVLSTLGAAYACAGRFPEAVAAIQHAQQLAPAQPDEALANRLQVQLKFFQAHSAFRDLGLTNVPATP